MKSIFKTFALAAAFFAASQTSQAGELTASQIMEIQKTVRLVEQKLTAMNMINWKVGEFHKNNVKLSLPFPGSGHKFVREDVPARNALWYINEMSILGQNQKTEALIDRANGQTLELIVNGEKQDVGGDDSQMEIIEQYETEVTVEAGTFECFYIKAKITQGNQTQELEAWINPIDVNLDGMLKVVVQSQLGPVTMTLTEFGQN